MHKTHAQTKSETQMSNSELRPLIIIGSGPAGYAAAVYASRAGLQPVVFEGAVTAGGR